MRRVSIVLLAWRATRAPAAPTLDPSLPTCAGASSGRFAAAEERREDRGIGDVLLRRGRRRAWKTGTPADLGSIFDRAGSASVGALAIAPSAEGDLRRHGADRALRHRVGRRVYRSDDGGASWRRIDSPTRAIGRITVDPRNGRGSRRGARASWSTASAGCSGPRMGGPGPGLFVDEGTGGRIWRLTENRRRLCRSGRRATTRGSPTTSRWSGRGAAHRSSDGGRTWKRVAGAVAAGASAASGSPPRRRRVWALVDAAPRRPTSRVYGARTTGATWTLVNARRGSPRAT
jgi:hypothetical protein